MKEIFEAFVARIKSPVFGYFIFSWLVFNWKALFYLLFSNYSIDDRIGHFDELTNTYSLAIFPFITASIITILYPWINYAFLCMCKKPIDLRNYLYAESENKLLIRKKQLEESRSVLLATKEKSLIDRAKRDAEIQEISDETTKKMLVDEIKILRNQIDNESNYYNNISSNERVNELIRNYRKLAELYAKTGNYEEAENYIRKVINMESKNNRNKY